MAATDAKPVPRYGEAFRAYFALRVNTGVLERNWVNPSGYISKDGGTWANVTNNPVEVGSRGCGYCDLTSSEMTADGVMLLLQTHTPSSMPLMLTFYPEQSGDYRADIVLVKGADFELGGPVAVSGIIQADVIRVNGLDVDTEGIIDSNVVQVSGQYVSLEDFGGTSTGATAAEVWEYATRELTSFPSGAFADAVWDEQIATHSVFGTAGRALTAASGNVFAGVLATPTNITAGTITTVTNLTNFPSGAVADAVWDEQIATHNVFGTAGRALTAASGNDFIGVHASPTNITAGTLTTVTNLTNFPSGAVADAVWDEILSGHQVIGTTGYALNTASGNLIGSGSGATAAEVWSYTTRTLTELPSGSIADAVWDEVLSEHITLGTAGWALTAASGVTNSIVNANIVKVSGEWVGVSNAVPANVVQVSGTLVHISDFNRPVAGSISNATLADDTITTAKIATNAITSSRIAADAITSSQLATSAVDEIVDQVWNELLSGHVTAGSTGDALNQASGILIRQGATGAGLTAIPTIANVTTVANLTNFPSGAVADAVWDEVVSQHQAFGTAGHALAAASGNVFVGSHASPTNITAGTITTTTNLTNFPSGAVADAVWDELISQHQVIGTTGYALNTASGNLIGSTSGPTAADIWSYSSRTLTSFPSGAFADAIWDEQIAEHSVFGTAGRALTAASGNVFAGVLATPTNITAGTITTVTNLTNFPSGAVADAVWDETLSGHQVIGTTGYALNAASGNLIGMVAPATIWSYGTRTLTGITDANIVQVSGEYVSIDDFATPVSMSGGATAAEVWAYGTRTLTSFPSGAFADAVWDEIITGHTATASAGKVITDTSTVTNTIQTNLGDLITDIGTNGAGLTAIPTIANVTNVANLTNFPSGAIADAVWDEQIATHNVFGTAGRALTAASGNVYNALTSGDIITAVWFHNLDEFYEEPMAGYILQNGLYTAISAVETNLTTNVGTNGANLTAIPTIANVSNLINFPSGAVADAVWDEQISTHNVFGTAGRALTAASGNVYAGVLATPTNITAGTITTVTNLTNFPSGAVADAVWDEQIATHSVFGTAGRALTAASGNVYAGVLATPTNITAGTLTSVYNLINFPSGAVADAVWDEVLSEHQTIGTAGKALSTASGSAIEGIIDANIVQLSGVYVSELRANLVRIKGDDFELGGPVTVSGIVQADVILVSGVPVGYAEIVDANIVQVSGEYVSIHDFATPVSMSGGATAAEVWAYGTRTLTSIASGEIAYAVWEEVLTGSTHNTTTSAGRRLRDLSTSVIVTGTCPSGAPTINSILLDNDAASVSGSYDPAAISIVAGTGAGQSRLIYQYDGYTKTATVDRNWKIAPDGTSQYVITTNPGREHVNEGLLRGATSGTAILNQWASTDDDAYNNQLIFIRSGQGEDQARVINDYNGATQTVTLCEPWKVVPNANSAYVMLPFKAYETPEIASGVWTYVNRTLTSLPSGAIADAVWDEQIATHNVFGTAGRALTAASGNDFIGVHASPTNITAGTITTVTNLTNFPSGAVADAVWDEVLSQHQVIGTAGYALNTASGNLIGGTTLTAAQVWSYTDRLLTSFPSGAFADAIWDEQIAEHNVFGTAGRALTAASGNVYAGVLATPTNITAGTITTVTNLTNFPSGAVADAVWDEVLSGHQVIGTTGYALNTASGNLIGGTTLTAAQVWSYTDRQLTSFPSGAFADAIWDEPINQHRTESSAGYALVVASGNLIGAGTSGSFTPADIWNYATRTLTGIVDANIVQISGQSAGLTGYIPANVVQISGVDVSWSNSLDANVIEVSGVPVSLADFGGTSGISAVSGVVSADIVSISGVPVNIDSSSVADSEELNTLGNLLLQRARIIRLVP